MQIKKIIVRPVPIAALSLVASLTSIPQLTQATDLPAPKGWVLQWGDNFAGTPGSLPSTTHWRVDTGHQYPNGPINWGTSEIERFTTHPANLHLDGKGHLLITPQRDANGQWTSGRIETIRDDFTVAEGGMLRMEARIQMPDVTGLKALGYWPAFWALGSNYRTNMKWPDSSEFDIMESVNGLDAVWGILHCGINPGGPCGEPIGIGSRLPCPHEACTAGPHTFTFEWNRSVSPEQLRWFVDGQLVNQVAENQMPAETWREITRQRGHFMLLDVAMGGGFSFVMAGWKPTPTPDTEPGHSMVVDYVAVWTKPGNGQKVPAPPEMAEDASKQGSASTKR
ncbi:glycosyl hydrolase family protein [Dyella sp. M7H15-1]|uniref:family 16 glycosylhydrolase n=1 Tax=Dyella sp. M7H15-1 TaxID=2501295 RepID=UPI00100525B6|nr:family 16 glycosylhydrolase [Dyella sp. M7H15-1]QAU23268.1 glycosyl hydrolase family protein [Dyella sp. M7H15-1]